MENHNACNYESNRLRAELATACKKIEQLQEIVDKLPKCWRLVDGELVQDVPVVPGMAVHYIDYRQGGDRVIPRTVQGVDETGWCISVPHFIRDGSRPYFAAFLDAHAHLAKSKQGEADRYTEAAAEAVGET